jgi:hypothetical protein
MNKMHETERGQFEIPIKRDRNTIKNGRYNEERTRKGDTNQTETIRRDNSN